LATLRAKSRSNFTAAYNL